MSANGLTDRESLWQMIQALAQMHPESRELPRFPSAAFLAGRTDGFEGFLVLDGGDGLGNLDDGVPRENDQGNPFPEVRVLDFSEAGLQLELSCENPLLLLTSSLSLEIQGERVPVILRWFDQSIPTGRVGVYFAEGALEYPVLMHLITRLGEDLLGFLLTGFKEGSVPFTRQAGSFAYLALFYTLRLHFLEALASVADLATEEDTLIPDLVSGLRSHPVPEDADPPLLKLFMKPIEDFGCALMGAGQNCIFLEHEALSLLRQTLFPIQWDLDDVPQVISALRFLHQSFLDLRALMPETFRDKEFEFPFLCYSAKIGLLESLRDQMALRLGLVEARGRVSLPGAF
jgi:hypothetical protein